MRKSIYVSLLFLGFVCKIGVQKGLAMPVTDISASEKGTSVGQSGTRSNDRHEDAYQNAPDGDNMHSASSAKRSGLEVHVVAGLVNIDPLYENLWALPQELVIPIFKYAHREATQEFRSFMIDFLSQNFEGAKTEEWEHAFCFSGLNVMEVLGDSSEQMQLLMTYIVNDRGNDRENSSVKGYKSMLRESPQLICQADARNKTCVHYALAMLSTCHAAAAANFLNYIFESKELRKFLPLGHADDKGNLPIHVIVNQLIILERLKIGSIQQSNYGEALVIAEKIAGRQPNFLGRTNKQDQAPVDLLKVSKKPSTLQALLCDDFDLCSRVIKRLREVEENFAVNFVLTDFHSRRAEKIYQVDQFYILLKKTPIIALDSTIKRSLHLLNTRNAQQNDLVIKSIRENELSILRLLLGNDAQASHAVYYASLWNRPEALTVLSNAGFDFNLMNGDYGRTVLHLAVTGDYTIELVRLLIHRGADLNVTDSDGKTALHWTACGNLHTGQEFAYLLLASGAGKNLTDSNGRTALHLAARCDDTEELVNIFITAGVDLNLRDNDGRTALHLAASRGHLSVVRSLVVAGADINLIDQDGANALQYAVNSGAEEVQFMLMDAGAM